MPVKLHWYSHSADWAYLCWDVCGQLDYGACTCGENVAGLRYGNGDDYFGGIA